VLASLGVVSSFVARLTIVRAGSGVLPVQTWRVSWNVRTASSTAAAVLVLVLALASGLMDLPGTWDRLSAQRSQFEDLSAADRAREPGTSQLLPVDAFDFFRSRVGEGDRYYLAVTKGGFTTGVDRAQAARIFGRFYLLPAVQVDAPDKANVVLTIGVEPHTLGVELGEVTKYAGGQYFVARVRR